MSLVRLRIPSAEPRRCSRRPLNLLCSSSGLGDRWCGVELPVHLSGEVGLAALFATDA